MSRLVKCHIRLLLSEMRALNAAVIFLSYLHFPSLKSLLITFHFAHAPLHGPKGNLSTPLALTHPPTAATPLPTGVSRLSPSISASSSRRGRINKRWSWLDRKEEGGAVDGGESGVCVCVCVETEMYRGYTHKHTVPHQRHPEHSQLQGCLCQCGFISWTSTSLPASAALLMLYIPPAASSSSSSRQRLSLSLSFYCCFTFNFCDYF